ncbi:MAG: hypothetical protein ACI3XI_01025 [Eubacteriales bacterium]
MKLNRLLCLFIALILLICSVGCTPEANNEPENTTEAPSNTTEETTEEVTLEPDLPSYDGPSEDFKFTLSNFISNDDFSAYADYLASAEKSFLVPGLAEKMVPQGMDIWTERGWLLISGYFDDVQASDCSVLLAIDMNTGAYVGEYYLTNIDGTPHTSHAGGVAVTDKNVYIAGSKTLYRIPLSSVISSEQCGKLQIVEEISVPVNASFCNYSEGYLWVGDFYYNGYPTEEFRHIKNRDGRKYCAWTVGYELDDSTENGFKAEAMVEGSYATPDVIFSMTDRIQGFSASADKIILSQSYGRTNDSVIYFYDNPMGEPAHKTVELNGRSVNLYFLDSKTNSVSLKALPMSEGITVRGETLYILYESGADKYANGGGKCPTENVWTIKIK